MKCPYCSGTQGRCATTSTGRSITECSSCGRVVEERQSQYHHLFHLRAQDNPLCLVTSDLPTINNQHRNGDGGDDDEEDPFESTGFITAFSTWSLESSPLFLRSSLSFSGHLAELERTFELLSSSSSSSSSSSAPASPTVVVDNLRAYMQIIDVSSILGLDYDISNHAFQLFRDCCSATCLRNRSVEALATAALVQAIREAQEPRTLQEISIAANVPQKEIGKYIKILGEALQLSQPINSNSISVHMPRFCTLLQLNKSAQELATHIGEVVINKCFCTRRNPISISAAAIYLACQLEDKRKTQAEICKVTGLTEVTLRKVYKELLENWDDLLPSNYTPAVPPEKAFPTTTIPAGRTSPAVRIDSGEVTSSEKDKQQPETKSNKPVDISEAESNGSAHCTAHTPMMNLPQSFRQPWLNYATSGVRTAGEKSRSVARGDVNEAQFNHQELDQMVDKDTPAATSSLRSSHQVLNFPASAVNSMKWPFRQPSFSSGSSASSQIVHPTRLLPGHIELKGTGCQNEVTLMLNAKINLPEKAEALRCYRDDLAKKQAAATKKKQAADKSREDAPAVPEHIYTSSLEHSPLKKRPRKDLTIDQGKNVESSSKTKSAAIALEPDSSMMLLSSGISSFRESTGFLERSNEFLLSADEEFLKGKKSEEVFNTGILSTFQALQAQFHLHDRYKIVSDKCAKFKMANDTLKADKAKLDKAIKEQKQKNLALEEDLKGVKEEKNRHCDESTQANTVLVEQERLVKGLKEQLTSIAAKAMCKARAEIFKEYLSGEHVNWSRVEIQEVVDTYEEMLKLEGFREADEEVDAGGEVDKSLENLDNIESPSAVVVDPTREDA